MLRDAICVQRGTPEEARRAFASAIYLAERAGCNSWFLRISYTTTTFDLSPRYGNQDPDPVMWDLVYEVFTLYEPHCGAPDVLFSPQGVALGNLLDSSRLQPREKLEAERWLAHTLQRHSISMTFFDPMIAAVRHYEATHRENRTPLE